MKKYILSALFSTIVMCSGALAQSMQFTQDDDMSCFMGDWDKYSLLKLRVSTTSPVIVKRMKTYLYKDDTLILYTDSSVSPSIYILASPYKDFTFNEFCSYDNTTFISSMMGEYEVSGKLLEGTYKVVVDITVFDPFGSNTIKDSTSFHVSPYLSAGLITPYNNAHIYDNTNVKNLVNFQWYPVNPTPSNPPRYSFDIKELYSGQTEEEAWANNSSLIHYFGNSTSFTPSAIQYTNLSGGKTYIYGE